MNLLLYASVSLDTLIHYISGYGDMTNTICNICFYFSLLINNVLQTIHAYDKNRQLDLLSRSLKEVYGCGFSCIISYASVSLDALIHVHPVMEI